MSKDLNQTERNIPEWFAHLQNKILEGLSKEDAQNFSKQCLAAIPVGTDVDNIKNKILIVILNEARSAIKVNKWQRQIEAIDNVIELIANNASQSKLNIAAAAALDAADAAAALAAVDAADAAADAAYAAAYSAYAAALAAAAAYAAAALADAADAAAALADAAAYAAADAAYAAAALADAADAYADARKQSYKRMADRILDVLRGEG